MGIFRSWIRGVLGASGVTLLVPLGLLAAVLVATTVGGSGLGSVGQLIGGPEVPGARAEVHPGERALPSVPSRRATRGEGAGTSTTSATTRRAAGREGRRERRRSSNRTTSERATGTGGRTENVVPPPPPPPPAQGTAPPPPPPPPPAPRNPIREIGKVVQDVVRPLPIVGPTASDAVGTVIDLIAPPEASAGVKKLLGGQ
ncbi:MAG TPA: hypothetical protein VFZ89_03530 [Solirubrobacteraceae bacterium]